MAQLGILLAGPLEQKHSHAGHKCIDNEGKHCADQERQNNVRHFQKRPRYRKEQSAAENRRRIRRDKPGDTHKLTEQTESPTPHDFKQYQNDGKRDEDYLPKR
jgi:hypothetical protein